MINLEEIIETITKFVDFINIYYPDSKEKGNAISRLEESVFWLTYMSGD